MRVDTAIRFQALIVTIAIRTFARHSSPKTCSASSHTSSGTRVSENRVQEVDCHRHHD